jgi:toxin ParE1/3/4
MLRPKAEADVEDTADYTLRLWGHKQALRYIMQLRRDIEQLATTALHYQVHDDIYPGLRRKRSGMHHIYFLVSDDSVDVLNIIHVTRDPAAHLSFGDEQIDDSE